MSEIQLNTIEEAIEDFREGKFLIVVDDEDRENERRLYHRGRESNPGKNQLHVEKTDEVYYAPRSRKNVAKSWSWICKLPITPLY